MVIKPEYDYVIIGGGSAGCVLADRLSASGQHSVLLVEAGSAGRHPSFHIPIGYVQNRLHPRGNWLYQTQEDMAGRSFFWPRGKVLGGCSAINGLLYIRGQGQDYDGWRDLGNAGWGWSDLLPYFIKSERQQYGADAYHGDAGPLAVEDSSLRHPVSDAFIEAAKQAGHRFNPDFNGADQEGVGYFQINVRNGRRQSTAVAYLRRARGRANLDIVTQAHAERILFEGRRASGLRFHRHGVSQEVKANREIIISAGAVNSPQLLELSGVGRAELLQGHGIPVVADLPGVGENLQDHLIVDLKYRVRNALSINEITRGPRLLGQILRYALTRKGLLSMSASHASVFLKSGPEVERPDVQYHFMPATLDKQTNAVERLPGMTCGPCQLRPDSRGSIHIGNGDFRNHPLIRPNYLEAEQDQTVVVRMLRLGRAICAQSAIEPYRGEELSPGPALQSDDELLDFARREGRTLYHPAGTCAMGRDRLAVVDSQLRVHQLTGLRVVDASIMPTLVSGNTNAPTIAIAEKAAELILADSFTQRLSA
jgi:choline dehydrogenase